MEDQLYIIVRIANKMMGSGCSFTNSKSQVANWLNDPEFNEQVFTFPQLKRITSADVILHEENT